MNILIKTISHKEQRYETCGDWVFEENGDIIIYVSELGNWKYEMAVAYHELREVLLCKALGISQESVDAFDIQFEKERLEGQHGVDEPGDDKTNPAWYAHQLATHDERNLIADLGEKWEEYEQAVLNIL